jgi:regulatory protein
MAVKNIPKLDQASLWDYALRVLGRRAHSAGEIQQKLGRRADKPGDIPVVMAKLREYGFADDQKFSEAFSASRLNNDGFGKMRVLRDLRTKRVPQKVAEAAIEKTFAGTSEQQLIDQFLARKYRSRNLHEFLQEDKNMNSAYRKLRLAGFSSAATLTALKKHSKRSADWEEPFEDPEQG